MTAVAPDTIKMGYCPYCGVTLRVLDDPHEGGYQITCGCRNLVVPYAQVPDKGNMRRVWEIAVKLRTKYDG